MNRHTTVGRVVVWRETAALFSLGGNSKASIVCITPFFVSMSHSIMFATSWSSINILYLELDGSLFTEMKNNKIQIILHDNI